MCHLNVFCNWLTVLHCQRCLRQALSWEAKGYMDLYERRKRLPAGTHSLKAPMTTVAQIGAKGKKGLKNQDHNKTVQEVPISEFSKSRFIQLLVI